MNLPQCKTCKLYRGDLCLVHPQGMLGNSCDDYRLQYETDFPENQLTRAQQWEILMTHPMFAADLDCDLGNLDI
ncbi:MAG: hypothetical protein DCE90_19860 [Pseudanabaena sp.]|nr:MAG: hypothetical protein DCE90_19860 [Pseudanabaena sp.]